jgi:beta-phosphoglucomutase-like phosphatase (HAD superfamily)
MFDLVAHGDCTKIKKPSPEIYEWALQKLQLPPEACLAIEDSPRGLESSNNASVKTIITPSKLTLGENFKDAKLVISNLGEPDKPFDVISGETYNHSYVSFELLKMISKN